MFFRKTFLFLLLVTVLFHNPTGSVFATDARQCFYNETFVDGRCQIDPEERLECEGKCSASSRDLPLRGSCANLCSETLRYCRIDSIDYNYADGDRSILRCIPEVRIDSLSAKVNNGFIELYWNEPEDGLDLASIYVYRASSVGALGNIQIPINEAEFITSVPPSPGFFVDKSAVPGKTYLYRLRLVNRRSPYIPDSVSNISNSVVAPGEVSAETPKCAPHQLDESISSSLSGTGKDERRCVDICKPGERYLGAGRCEEIDEASEKLIVCQQMCMTSGKYNNESTSVARANRCASDCRQQASGVDTSTMTGDQTKIVKISGLNRIVEIQQGGGAWVRASEEVALRVGDKIHTGFRAGATLTFPDGSTVVLKPMTLAKIESIESGGRPRIRFGVDSGQVSVRVNRPIASTGEFEVVTPTATASVRGTVFDVGYDGSETKVSVTEGTVSVKPENSTLDAFDVVAGQETTISENSATPPAPISEDKGVIYPILTLLVLFGVAYLMMRSRVSAS